MNFTRHKNVVAMPLADGKSGLFSDQGLIENSLLKRGDKTFYQAVAPADPVEWIEGEVLFGGYTFPQYGHFLLEGLARLWLASDFPGTPIVWLSGAEYTTLQREILALVGISNPPFFVRQPVGFRSILVPESGYVLRKHYDPDHAAFLAVFPEIPPAAGRKVWLSRTRLRQADGMVVNQQNVEHALDAAGWTIFHPQEHPVRVQLRVLAGAKRIAGIAGSAFHSFVLMKKVHASVDIFQRFPLGPVNDYTAIAQIHGIDQRIHKTDSVQVGAGNYDTQAKYQWVSVEPVLDKLL